MRLVLKYKGHVEVRSFASWSDLLEGTWFAVQASRGFWAGVWDDCDELVKLL